MAIKCTECGASIQDDSRFCKYCGAKLPEEAKIDIKKREYKIETVNHTSMRKAELKNELAQAKLQAEKEKKTIQAKKDKVIYLVLGVGLIISMIVLLISTR